MMEKYIKYILHNICLAQKTSNCAKCGYEDYSIIKNMKEQLEYSSWREEKVAYYAAKDSCIYKAITALRHCPPCGINYYIGPDNEKVAKYIVYFDIKVDNKRYQVSFHGFNSDLEKRIGEGRKTRWTREKGGSDKNCDEIIEKYL